MSDVTSLVRFVDFLYRFQTVQINCSLNLVFIWFFHIFNLPSLLIQKRSISGHNYCQMNTELILKLKWCATLFGRTHNMAKPGVSLVHCERARNFLYIFAPGLLHIPFQLLLGRTHRTLLGCCVRSSHHRVLIGAAVKLRVKLCSVFFIQDPSGDAFPMYPGVDVWVAVAGVEKNVHPRVTEHSTVVYSEQNKESAGAANLLIHLCLGWKEFYSISGGPAAALQSPVAFGSFDRPLIRPAGILGWKRFIRLFRE